MKVRVKFFTFLLLSLFSLKLFAGAFCTPGPSTAFTDFENMAYRISNDASGVNNLYSYCTDFSNESLLGQLSSCTPNYTNPINGLGLNPTDKLLYGLSPTDALGIGAHLEVTVPFPAPGKPGDIMKADSVDVYRIGSDGGYEKIGSIQPPAESVGLPADTHQVVPIVHNASSFNQSGDLFVLAYRTNYSSSADVPAGTAEVVYEAPQIVIGRIANADLVASAGGNIATSWNNITMDPSCNAVVNKFRDDTNVYSVCVVNQYLMTGDENAAVQSCIASTPILDKGIHDFAVSPVNGHFYGYDSMTFDDKDVLVEMNPNTNTASCTEIADPGNSTGVLNSVMFSKQNKLLTIFANQTSGSWIDVNTGVRTALTPTLTAAPFGDGGSLPFAGVTKSFFVKGSSISDLIFKNGFEDVIFANGFETTSISLEKTGIFVDANGDGLAQVGETIDYNFTVTNTGVYPVENIIINDPLMTVPGNLASLEVSQADNSTFAGTYTLNQNDIDAGLVSNLATASGSDPFNQLVTASSNQGVPFVINLPVSASITLQKTGAFIDKNNDGVANIGDTIDYTFAVENTGNQTLKNITVDDPLLTVAGAIAELAPAATDNSTLKASYTLTQADIDAGRVSNTATANAEDPAGNAVSAAANNNTAFVVNLPVSASISLTKIGAFVDTVSDGVAGIGDTINYSFTVTNTGTQTLTNISINDPLFTVSATLASLAPGASDNSTFGHVYTLTQNDINNGSVTNLANVTANTPANSIINAESNNGVPLVTNFNAVAAINLVKSGVFNDTNGDGLAQAGETIDYSFTVNNIGSLTLSNISISDPLTPVNGTLASLNVATSDSSSFSASYTLNQQDIDNGSVSNTASVTAFDPMNNAINADSNGGSAVVTNLPVTASMSLLKTAQFNDENMDGLAQSGETISYSFSITNTGNVTLSNLSVSDPLMTVNGSLASLAVGDSDNSTFSGTYTLTQADVDNASVSNLATANATDPSSNAVSVQSNNGVLLVTNLLVNPSISLVKSGQFIDSNTDGFAQVGETIEYSFTVTNTGNQTLSNVSITDPLMNVPGMIASLAPGDSDSATFSGTYTLTQADLNAGSVSNTATANASDPNSSPISAQSNGGAPLVINVPVFSCPDF